jgi:hypothetical protein
MYEVGDGMSDKVNVNVVGDKERKKKLLNLNKVFAVFECVAYEGDYLRGVYASNDEAKARKIYLDDTCPFPLNVANEVRELAVGVDVDII